MPEWIGAQKVTKESYENERENVEYFVGKRSFNTGR